MDTFGLPGNAPGPHAPHACILLLYYSPSHHFTVGAPRIELGSRAPKARILPLYYTPVRLGLCFGDTSRSAENRTRVSRTRSVYTTAVLHSEEIYSSILGLFRLIFFYLRLWFSGRMRPCQGRDGSSILPSRTATII